MYISDIHFRAVFSGKIGVAIGAGPGLPVGGGYNTYYNLVSIDLILLGIT